MKKSARYTAAQALLRLAQSGAYSNLVLEPLIAQNRLDARDGAFASAVFYTALERRVTIDHILKKYSRQPLDGLDPAVLAILRTGVAQLAWMDGVDDYAAVNESVNLAREFGKAKASGFVNGVLRSFLRDGKQVPPAAGGQVQALSVAYSCPEWLVALWLEAYGQEACERILAHSLGRPPVYLRANTLRIDAQGLVRQLAEEGVQATAQPPEGCVRVDGKIPVETLASFREGLFHVQDRASQLCAAALAPQPGERVLDVCAAPGGKSFTIAQLMQNRGEVVARDLHEKRVRLIAEGAGRLGISAIAASAGDASEWDAGLGGFDRVLCDVPCSGFGIIRRKPEIKYKPQKAIQNLPEIQYKILQTSAHYLKPGGRLVYSTCTLLPAENEQVVGRFLQAQAGFALCSQTTYTGEELDTDGFFVAVMEKR